MAKKETKQKKQKHFFRDFKAEIKKVIWPTPKQLVNTTVAIITIVVIVAVIVACLDIAFKFVSEDGLTKLQEVVRTVDNEENNGEDANNEISNSVEGTETTGEVQQNNEATVDGANEADNQENNAKTSE